MWGVQVTITALGAGESSFAAIGWVPGNKLSAGKHLNSVACAMCYESTGEVHGSGFASAPAFAVGDVIGVGWAFQVCSRWSHSSTLFLSQSSLLLAVVCCVQEREKAENVNFVFFTRNGEELGPKYWAIRNSSGYIDKLPTLAPAITAHGTFACTANFGQKPFKFAEVTRQSRCLFCCGWAYILVGLGHQHVIMLGDPRGPCVVVVFVEFVPHGVMCSLSVCLSKDDEDDAPLCVCVCVCRLRLVARRRLPEASPSRLPLLWKRP